MPACPVAQYIIIRGALTASEVQRFNDHLDALPRPAMGEWIGRAHVTPTGGSGFAHGCQIQQCYELGGPFEELVDHPSFFGKVRRFLGPEAGGKGDSGWDNHPHGLPTIDEAFVNFRSEGAPHTHTTYLSRSHSVSLPRARCP